MPGILSEMEVSEPSPQPSTDATNRRKSGRAVQKPVLYQEDPRVSLSVNGSTKRKRSDGVPEGDDDANEESSGPEDESEPDEEELKEQRRRAKKPAQAKKPAAKKPKRSGEPGVTLAMRPATNGVKKASKARKPRTRIAGTNVADAEGTGLYGRCDLRV